MTPFGRYQLVRKLATGGMAEIYLAKVAGQGGFEKTLVVKKLLAHLAEDPSFVEMFSQEARLAAGLNHPNVVQIFDFGDVDGSYFIAMEYVDGVSLRGLLRLSEHLGRRLPPMICAGIVSLACEGLAYAHEYADPDSGQLLHLVHRDVSPDNILLSRAGAVKVTDFGIAKARSSPSRTQTGMVKGKFAYMSPEQVKSEPLDLRSDVYSLGVVLYELLAGKRPFDHEHDVSLVMAIVQHASVPLVSRRDDVPASLTDIVEKAMAYAPADRYASCHELQEALEGAARASGESVGPSRIAKLLSEFQRAAGSFDPNVRKPVSSKSQRPAVVLAGAAAPIAAPSKAPSAASLGAPAQALAQPSAQASGGAPPPSAAGQPAPAEAEFIDVDVDTDGGQQPHTQLEPARAVRLQGQHALGAAPGAHKRPEEPPAKAAKLAPPPPPPAQATSERPPQQAAPRASIPRVTAPLPSSPGARLASPAAPGSDAQPSRPLAPTAAHSPPRAARVQAPGPPPTLAPAPAAAAAPAAASSAAPPSDAQSWRPLPTAPAHSPPRAARGQASAPPPDFSSAPTPLPMPGPLPRAAYAPARSTGVARAFVPPKGLGAGVSPGAASDGAAGAPRAPAPAPVKASGIPPAASLRAPPRPLAGSKLLVVDDSELTAKVLQRQLQGKGLEVVRALSVHEASEILFERDFRPDLILVDVRMPSVDGSYFCRIVRSDPRFAQIRVLLCSALEPEQLKREVELCGADGFVTKNALLGKAVLQEIRHREGAAPG